MKHYEQPELKVENIVNEGRICKTSFFGLFDATSSEDVVIGGDGQGSGIIWGQ